MDSYGSSPTPPNDVAATSTFGCGYAATVILCLQMNSGVSDEYGYGFEMLSSPWTDAAIGCTRGPYRPRFDLIRTEARSIAQESRIRGDLTVVPGSLTRPDRSSASCSASSYPLAVNLERRKAEVAHLLSPVCTRALMLNPPGYHPRTRQTQFALKDFECRTPRSVPTGPVAACTGSRIPPSTGGGIWNPPRGPRDRMGEPLADSVLSPTRLRSE